MFVCAYCCVIALRGRVEVTNLIEVGRAARALGEVLGTDDAAGLAALHALVAAANPAMGFVRQSTTVFDLAADSAHAYLLGQHPIYFFGSANRPGLWRRKGGEERMEAAEILVFAGGVWLQDVRFTETPTVMEETYNSLAAVSWPWENIAFPRRRPDGRLGAANGTMVPLRFRRLSSADGERRHLAVAGSARRLARAGRRRVRNADGLCSRRSANRRSLDDAAP